MTELLEAVAVDIAGPDSTKCPFDCGKTCDASNNFTRAEKFGANVTSGVPTIRFRRKDDGNFAADNTPTTPKYPPKKKSFPNEWGWAAHHLIPVSTLRDHGLRKYLDKGSSGTEVSCDAGYEVNGTANGLWSIASYTGMQKALKDPAVAALVQDAMKRAGIAVKGDQSAYSAMSADAKAESEDALGFREWLFATMQVYGRQFHDSHGPYEDFVETVLDKVQTNLVRLKKSCLDGNECKDASKKPMAPHRISRRLDHISRRLSGHLVGDASRWKNPLFTSAFAKMYAIEIQGASSS